MPVKSFAERAGDFQLHLKHNSKFLGARSTVFGALATGVETGVSLSVDTLTHCTSSLRPNLVNT